MEGARSGLELPIVCGLILFLVLGIEVRDQIYVARNLSGHEGLVRGWYSPKDSDRADFSRRSQYG